MPSRTTSTPYRESTIIVKYADDGVSISCVYIEGTSQTFSSVDDAKRSIDDGLDLPPSPPDVQPPRPRIRR
jgi:hypothetical protein